MAYSLRLTGVGKDGSDVFSIEPDWWDISVLEKNPDLKWIATNDTGSYADRDVDIPTEEARRLHELFKPALLEKISRNSEYMADEKKATDEYAAKRLEEYASYGETLESQLHSLDDSVADSAGEISHFHLCIFEWESGQ